MANYRTLGEDLDLGFVADEEGRTFAGPHSFVDFQARRRRPLGPREADLGVVAGIPSLVQAIIVRLKTERGELAALGHPDYGTRHLALVGEPNTEANRNLLKLYILECLRQEPRIESIERLDVRPVAGPEGRDMVDVEIAAKITGSPAPLNLVVPFSFEGPLP
jgi:phage baseplate assembly protein W